MLKGFKRLVWQLAVIVSVLSAFVFAGTPAFAGNTADVTVYATPQFLSITVSPTSYNFTVVVESSNTTTANTSYFTIDNSCSVTANMSIGVTTANWSGGVQWINSTTATPGVDTAGLYACKGPGTWGTDEVIVKAVAGANKISTNQASNTDFYYGLDLMAPSTFGDGVEKSIIVRVTAYVGA